MAKRKPDSVDTYVAELPSETREVLEQLRALVHAAAPNVTERISYGIPTFDLNGKNLLAIAGWKKHVSLYPITSAMAAAFKDEIKAYRTGPGTLQFPLEQPLPVGFIRGLIKVRVEEAASVKTRTGRRR